MVETLAHHRSLAGDNSGGDPASLCGKWLYRQADIRRKKSPSHLLRILNDPSKAAGVCKHCEKAAGVKVGE